MFKPSSAAAMSSTLSVLWSATMMMTMLATTAQAQSPNGTATASAAEVSASVLASLPGCGVSCVREALRVSGCELTDRVCVCQNTAFLCPVVKCEAVACSADENEAISAYTRGYCAPTGGRNFSPVCAATSNFNSTLPGSSGKPPGSPQANSTSAYKPSAPVNTVSPYQGLAGRSAALGFGMVVVLGMGMGVALGGI